ncbi:MAG: D-glycero-beta-D-manno-heptose-7-phosphate kinase, partial [Helicobacter japonicus]|nr:D-glycero-beta-D-manno-heptose-7-phosphate kinase [Helicobacter japonicus]
MFNLESKSPKILVIGDLMIDHYVWGSCERISPEAPVQVVDVKNESNRLGGACNVAHNLIALNAQVFVCGVVGNDDTGLWLGDKLESIGVDISYLFVDTSRPTTKKTRVIIANQQVLRIDRESKAPIDSSIQIDIMQRLHAVLDEVDCIIISDYGKGLLNDELTQFVITYAKKKSKFVLCDPKGKDYSKYRGATLLTPNKKEAELATDIIISNEESLIRAGMTLKNKCQLDISLITLSEDGIGIFANDAMERIPTRAKEVYDVTGAGDTVIAALGFALSSGCDILQACEFANA